MMIKLLRALTFLFLFSGATKLCAQKVLFYTDSIPRIGISIDHAWRFHKGDDPQWAAPGFDDKSWDTLSSPLKDVNFDGIVWLRQELIFDSSFAGLPMALVMEQTGASDVYFDGKLLVSLGKVSEKEQDEKRHDTHYFPVAIDYTLGKKHLLAVRYSNHELENSYVGGKKVNGFNAYITNANKSFSSVLADLLFNCIASMAIFSFFFALGIVHLLLFLFYKKNRSNLYYFMFMLCYSFYPLCVCLSTYSGNIQFTGWLSSIMYLSFPLFFTLLLALAYSFFYEKFPKFFRIMLGAMVVITTGLVFEDDIFVIADVVFVAVILIEVFRVVIVAVRKKKKGAKIIGAGFLLFAGFIMSMFIILLALLVQNERNFDPGEIVGFLIVSFAFLALASIPVSMSVFLARDFSDTNNILEKKLIEVKDLSDKTIEQEKEKQLMLANQNELLEHQVIERTAEIVEQKKQIEEKNKDITDSINYAKRIQDAFLPAKEIKYRLFPNAFVYFQPKDIVSGDFYWFTEKNGVRIIAAADCTGHGVPGALMSMIGSNLLNEIVSSKGITDPGEILNELHKGVRIALKQVETETRDGMDIAICTFENGTLRYSGAQRPLWMIRNRQLEEVKADKFSIGGLQTEEKRIFTSHTIPVSKDDTLYIFSDGFADQFGGPNGKKFMSKQLKELLLSIQDLPMNEQEKKLEQQLQGWKHMKEQVDDVLVIGIKI